MINIKGNFFPPAGGAAVATEVGIFSDGGGVSIGGSDGSGGKVSIGSETGVFGSVGDGGVGGRGGDVGGFTGSGIVGSEGGVGGNPDPDEVDTDCDGG
ncbi:hypothetical protein HY945_01165 [Candidatus Gottesmanbacteria bacterium]|nr:hypothetical protein [Candidatus Gottesmanbacteria bacterium]